ncbi:hypothetical protein EGR_10114 [Echinococcus granulosus]|uniref:Uncharacterized protein n=1 Tax=Echinococcus granulosus TaxID=6210 RepID=W6U1U5_ECHGR|nr:hypothetical protein EGR_10114 [Echinococcus granulosus]EUB55018.1 hypothetical protein EGR_10114 [Echinococcus granulosus]
MNDNANSLVLIIDQDFQLWQSQVACAITFHDMSRRNMSTDWVISMRVLYDTQPYIHAIKFGINHCTSLFEASSGEICKKMPKMLTLSSQPQDKNELFVEFMTKVDKRLHCIKQVFKTKLMELSTVKRMDNLMRSRG